MLLNTQHANLAACMVKHPLAPPSEQDMTLSTDIQAVGLMQVEERIYI